MHARRLGNPVSLAFASGLSSIGVRTAGRSLKVGGLNVMPGAMDGGPTERTRKRGARVMSRILPF